MRGLEGLERRHPITKIDEPYLVEVPLPPRDGQIPRPPVRHSLIDDGAAGVDLFDAIGARTQRDLERGLGKIARLTVGAHSLPIMLGQDRKLADDQRQLAVALDVEGEGDAM